MNTLNPILGPADIASIGQALQGLAYPARDDLSESWQAEATAFNDEVATLKSLVDDNAATLQLALDAADSGEIGSVAGLVSASADNRLDNAQRIVTLWSTRKNLAEMAVDEFAVLKSEADTKLDKVLKVVEADLEKVGAGLSTQRAIEANPKAARRTFDLQIRSNARSRPAIARANDLKHRKEAAQVAANDCNFGEATARKYLKTLILASAGVTV